MKLNRKLGLLALGAAVCFPNFSTQACFGTKMNCFEIEKNKIFIVKEFDILKPFSFALFPFYYPILNVILTGGGVEINMNQDEFSFSFKSKSQLEIHTRIKYTK